MRFIHDRPTVRPRPRGGVLIALLALALMTSLAAAAGAETYYVDNQSATCSDAGPGTEAQPYCSIAAAVAAHRGAGVTIIVKPGTYREQITISASGASGSPFVIQAQGPGVMVDGADDLSDAGLWAPATGPAWLASGVDWSPNQVFLNGERLTRATTAPAPSGEQELVPDGAPRTRSPIALDELPVNAFAWVPGEGLYVNLGGDNPGTQQILVGRRHHGFNLFSKSWVTIDGFAVSRTEDRAINIQNGCADLVISRNRVSFANSYGIQSVNGVRLLIADNVVSDCDYHGIGLVNGATGCILRNNESFRNAQPGVRAAKGIYLYAAPNNTLQGNRLHDNQDTGMQFSAGSNNCIAYANQSWSNGDHGFDHLDVSGTIHFNNVAYGNYMDGFSIEGDSPNTQLFNCISVQNGLTTNRFDLWVNAASSVGFFSDHNIFWNSTPQPPIKYIATKYATVAEFQAATGQDAHSLQDDPRFVNGGEGKFAPSSGSPAIDAGDSGLSGWPATDAVGNAPLDDPATPNHGTGPVTYADIGALEFVPTDDVELLTRARPPVEVIGAQKVGETPVTALALSNAFPNPSRGAVEFALDLRQDAPVRWAVYDLQGRMVWSEDRALGAGRTRLRWEGATASGELVATGVYLVRARVNGAEVTRRLVRF